MTKTEIEALIKSVLADEFEVEEETITPDANVKSTLNLDSLSLVDMVALVSEETGVKIPTADLPTIQTFQNLYDYIESHQA